ncbi:MAG: mobile mystery protein A [Gammaproteobacteria bacterium]|nr:mobile mystery protein A [Gammaproteobacteria bacterium]
MNIKKIVISQYGDIVNAASMQMQDVSVPKEGWLKTVRKALNMSVTQLAKRLDVTRSLIYKTEKAEQSGGITLNKMKQVAQALECRFIYAVVPSHKPYTIESIVETMAKKMAMRVVMKTQEHMALEAQAISKEQIELEIDRVADEILKERTSELWNIK